MTDGVMDTSPQTTQYRIDALGKLPLEPLEYCRKWIDMSPDERGYRKACIAALAEATGLSPRTIGNWGQNFERRPDYVAHILRMADMLNQIRQIVLPPDFPQK
ncbi:hypothetical protein WA1_24100 [Scytonema hofmannii PCC 7110]|uniref:Uncharacterized protein n=1 Tax=Scytonema hofmannii PCC 7110 TaxID=128403 RepID=A0A139X7T8_9CYAN|nr:hypothetical protein [Scytonema hofmannii]KYC40725.1 hypothetical protein WA1_24100 [Scytonema hofmannii PCC 7110]USN26956.1 hypothetical protein [synthetic construct]